MQLPRDKGYLTGHVLRPSKPDSCPCGVNDFHLLVVVFVGLCIFVVVFVFDTYVYQCHCTCILHCTAYLKIIWFVYVGIALFLAIGSTVLKIGLSSN